MAEKENVVLSQEQTYSVVQFAQSLLNDMWGLYTPQLLNQNLINLNVNPQSTNYDKIVKALNDAKYKAKELQEYSQWMEYNDMLFSKVLNYYSNMLSFDLSWSCKNVKNKNEYKSKEYKDDERRVGKFLDNFDYREEFRKMLVGMLRYETVFTWLRTNRGSFIDTIDENEDDYKIEKMTKYTLQTMPQQYGLLTGYFEQGILYSFDMNWFLRPGVSLQEYDPFFTRAFKNMFVESSFGNYIPTNPIGKQDGTWAYWTQTDPDCGAWVFKFENSNFNNVPPLAALMRSAILDNEISKLQWDKDIQSAYALLSGELKMIDGQKSGEVKNAFAISPDVLGQFMSLVQKGMQKNIKVAALPLEETRWNQFSDGNPNMSSNQSKNTAGLGTSASRMIYSTDKMSAVEVENAILTDYNFVNKVYAQFENFLDFYINKKTKKYKFSFSMTGSKYLFERANRRECLQELVQIGLVPNLSSFASAYGYRPQEFKRMIEEGSETLEDLTLVLQTINTQSGNKGAGRPRKKSGDLKSASRDYDTSNE